MGPGAHETIGPEALKLGFRKTLIMTSGLRGTDTVHEIAEPMKYHGLEVVIYDKVESRRRGVRPRPRPLLRLAGGRSA